MGKVRIAEMKGASIPEGWVLTSDGKKTTDPGQMAGMCPLGAEESTCTYVRRYSCVPSYKGYGLAMMVEVFCGILAGAQYGPRIRKWPGEMHRQADLADGETEVLVPGDPERKHMAKCDQQGGILYHPNQIKKNELAAKLNVKPVQTL
ncbi:YJMC-like protein [Mya arenaria]|uniref:YJMC-like protein n=1 Tax=Mya arenaria TaxID=6604 RepID=A0ABY7EWC5_MYAAR|nr:YJMC-like protein [Mya arenaria]